ncbi:hypothetical protein AURANDRAFT_66561 [Aureococcus anophagefferens]|uniref:DM10 domain-containing protein n=1 Tax=Aureococcus anophagefferens TaxID=44056 RepID=F0YI14_AURAN|nr:hypothetical protein AURANDRAFT_66561 [Aureococcus anophagefferens]EGB05247.1 hypothetical protein AURANDRAFT_66561 [Aureococcus anophagefferens]|eukprot:XP_009040148.1 hypothetical protein AURANDRAFT_66561 [Aureococcus anophagefferens]
MDTQMLEGSSSLSCYESLNEELLPQLPGYRCNRHSAGNRNQTIKYINRHMFLTAAKNVEPYDQYGRIFHVNGCNESTRNFLRNMKGAEPNANSLPPVDRYETERSLECGIQHYQSIHFVLKRRRDLMSRETGKDPTVSHNIQKNPMKAGCFVCREPPALLILLKRAFSQVFAEAALGNTVDNSGRHGFLKYGTSVLRFYCYWDDSSSLYGDVLMFKVHSPNSGRDSYPLLLKRAKLPKSTGGFYHWTDLKIGCTINAYSRLIKMIDADRATREFYLKEGIDLGSRLAPPVEDHPVALERMPPPYSGFGSEEDSLTSCAGSLVQKAPAKHRGEEGVLRYQAAFANPKPEDRGRLFVLVYYSTEFALMIREPPRRNSGVVGGNFLAKMKLKHPDGKLVTAADIAVTQLYTRLANVAWSDEDTRRAALDVASHGCGALDFNAFEKLLTALGSSTITIADVPPKQAMITMWRHYATDGQIKLIDLPF